jgi:hypothetical protein
MVEGIVGPKFIRINSLADLVSWAGCLHGDTDESVFRAKFGAPHKLEKSIVKKSFVVPVVLVGLLGFSATAHTATIAAASCSSAAVTAAVASAANGDTVIIPAGTCTWSTLVTINKAITLQGQGVGVTKILDGVTSGALMNWVLVANQFSRMTGIEFGNGGGSHQGDTGVVNVNGANTDGRRMRIDHCYFNHLTGVAIVTRNVIGVIDHNTYVGVPNSRFANVWHNSWNGVPWGDGSWSSPTSFGTENFTFFEDNTMSYDGNSHYAFFDAFGGARYVVRHNTITKGWVEAHGTDSTQRYRGTRAVEIYNNTLTGNDTMNYLINMRSGVVLAHNNTATGYQTSPKLELANYRAGTSYIPWGMANGASPWDKNVGGIAVTVLDQPCVSGGSPISGDPPVLPWSSGQNNQVVDACYAWNNKEDGIPVPFHVANSNIVLGVHFFNTPKPGYTPYTYPHPLTTGGGSSSGPQAPTNLRISSQE